MEERICLEEGEHYEKGYGEIILTTMGRIVIHCTECEEKYENFEAFSNHIFNEHIKSSEHELDLTKTDLFDTLHCNDENSLKTGTEFIEDDALREEEVPISELKEPKKRKLFNRHTTSSQESSGAKTQISADVFPEVLLMGEQFNVANVVRDVQKRTNWVTAPIPTEQRKHKCPICGLAFKDKCNVSHHLIRHSEHKKFECPECNKKFYTTTEVNTHMRCHRTDRNFLCSDCGRSFKTKFQLWNHIKRHKNQRDYKCRICDKAYFDSRTLKDHMYVHSKEKTIVCKLCDSKFTRPMALKNHMKLHENKRAYKCNICDASFNQNAGLFSHMKITHQAT